MNLQWGNLCQKHAKQSVSVFLDHFLCCYMLSSYKPVKFQTNYSETICFPAKSTPLHFLSLATCNYPLVVIISLGPKYLCERADIIFSNGYPEQSIYRPLSRGTRWGKDWRIFVPLSPNPLPFFGTLEETSNLWCLVGVALEGISFTVKIFMILLLGWWKLYFSNFIHLSWFILRRNMRSYIRYFSMLASFWFFMWCYLYQ